MLSKLKKLLGEGEEIFLVYSLSWKKISFIGPQKETRDIDVASAIEDTLHRLLEEGYSNEEIFEILGAEKLTDFEELTEEDHYIDLDYVIIDFSPVEIKKSGIVYQRPQHQYIATYGEMQLCKNIILCDEATDDEILESLKDALGISPDEYIVIEKGENFIIKEILQENEIFLKKRVS